VSPVESSGGRSFFGVSVSLKLMVSFGGCATSAETKLETEKNFLSLHPSATIFRPSLVFGPGDSFFTVSGSPSQSLPSSMLNLVEMNMSTLPFVAIRNASKLPPPLTPLWRRDVQIPTDLRRGSGQGDRGGYPR